MTHTIAVFNHKGGVGKTTTVVNLAAGLSRYHDKRCLVVDTDPQANATRALLGHELPQDQRTLRHVLLREVGFADTIVKTDIPKLKLAPADLALSEAEFKLASSMSRELVLKEQLEPTIRSYDYVIIDCGPSLGLLALNGLAAADHAIIPCETQFLSLRGLHYVLDVLSLIQAKLNPKLNILGVLATKFYVLSRANNEALQCMRSFKNLHVFNAVIPRDVKAEEAPSHGKPLTTYAPDSRAARQYLLFAEEVNRLCPS